MLSRGVRDDGFTLVELMVVVLIIGILVSIAVASYWFTATHTREVACQANRETLDRAVYTYTAMDGQSPTSIDDLADYVKGFDHVIECPEDRSQKLYLDVADQMIVCPIHGK